MKNFIHDPHDSNSPIHVLKKDHLSWCGLLYAFWEEVPDEKLQATAKHCVKCHQNWQGLDPEEKPVEAVKEECKYVLVSPAPFMWEYVSADYLLNQAAGTLRYDEIKEFLKYEVGSFIPLDEFPHNGTVSLRFLFKVKP